MAAGMKREAKMDKFEAFDGKQKGVCTHRWTGFIHPVTHGIVEGEFQCVECGIKIKDNSLWCINGELHRKAVQ